MQVTLCIILLNLVNPSVLCTGICDYDLVTLALSGNRCDTFTDRHGNVKAQLLDGDTIRPINCSGVVQGISGVLCESCKSYRHSLLAILSKERPLSTSSKHEPPSLEALIGTETLEAGKKLHP